ncbi:MAG: hypothetical protein HOP91_02545 [Sphingomonas sp.]|nr:hypothetical protein [Sphingomonas sp.]
MLRERFRADDPHSENDNSRLVALSGDEALSAAAIADRFRTFTVGLVLASIVIAIAMEAAVRVRIDLSGAYIFDWIVAAMLLISRMWWQRKGKEGVADVAGTVGLVGLGGMAGGAIAMLELRFGLPLADPMLWSLDRSLGFNGIAAVDMLVRQGHWIFAIMAPSYNFTVPLFFAGLIILSLIGERVEAWRAAFCFVGTLLTTCIIAIAVPAKGLAMWAPQELLDRLPPVAMRSFWPHFDEFYFGADPVLRLQAIDGVVSYPSFHCIVGFLVLAMWRKNVLTLIAAAAWLVFMLLATLPGGGHYLVDLIAGFVVWAVWFVLSRRIERQAGARSGRNAGLAQVRA